VAFKPSKFIKRQIHLQVTKARHRNAADTLDEDYRRVGPHTIVQRRCSSWGLGLAQNIENETMVTVVFQNRQV